MSSTQNNGRSTRELVGEDGTAVVELWLEIAMDPLRRAPERLHASELLADRGWQSPSFPADRGG
jgi:hypothetical protein